MANLRQTFLQALRQEWRQTRDPPHRTFIKWYVRTRFGAAATVDLTDGARGHYRDG
jgi:hypothetical protein